MLAHRGAMLDHVVGDVGPSGTPRGDLGLCWGYVVFMTSPSFPKFCLKKLSPVACEAPTPFSQHHFSEKPESCWGRAHPRGAPEGSHQWPARFQETLPEGRKGGSEAPGGFPVAEATIQATTSLPLHGMAGLYGLRPAPAMPGQRNGQRRREGSRTIILSYFIQETPPEGRKSRLPDPTVLGSC